MGQSGGRVDANQKEIVAALRTAGIAVLVTSNLGRGFPDLLTHYGGRIMFVEIKNRTTGYGRRGLNKNQEAFRKEWDGAPYAIVYTAEEAIKFCRAGAPVAVVETVEQAIQAMGRL